jgi:hypothetical protein
MVSTISKNGEECQALKLSARPLTNNMQPLLDLGTQPLVNNLCASAREAMEAERFPLKAFYGDDLTICLDTEVPPEKLYAHYLYRSGVSKPYIDHCEKLYASLAHLDLSTVIDIGGNDGTLLNTFRAASSKYKFWSGKPPQEFINVDMGANLREANEATGNKFICGQFNGNMDLPAANLIVSTNVFQHTQDIHSFLRGIVKFLDGVWVLEFPYTLTTLLTNQFDQFYHEHYYYWLLSPLIKLFHHYGLKIIHLQELPIHGGTMRLWMTNKEPSAAEITPLLDDYKHKEGLIDFSAFQANCTSHMQKSKNFLSCLKGRIAFFGAAAKGCVFLNALGLSIENMPNAFIIDDTPEKQGMFVPGTGFEIHPRSVLDEQTVDNIIILPHNFARYIASTLRPAFNGGIYTMLPSIASF